MRPPKDPQKRIHEILDASEYLFRTKGYENTTIQDISQRMGVAQGTLYYYFKSKEKVLEGVLNRKAKQIIFVVQQIKKGPLKGFEKLSEIISQILQKVSAEEGIFLDLMNDEHVAYFMDQMLEHMAVLLTQEFVDFIGYPEENKEIQVEQPDTVIYFTLEMINVLMGVLCEDLPPQKINEHIRMGEKILSSILDCQESRIKIRLA